MINVSQINKLKNKNKKQILKDLKYKFPKEPLSV